MKVLRNARYRAARAAKNKKTKRQHDKKTNLQKDKKTKKQKEKKTKRQRPKREFNIVTSGQFRTLAMFFSLTFLQVSYLHQLLPVGLWISRLILPHRNDFPLDKDPHH